ncbi:uncharacterized protein LOC109862600 [Pseudomyrmex gracilis]|uniref:uncharacterized protein LOC109862600 n=1 Tax=Pseudomyrmex gracilis TaxID=219809 RepID=UPI000994A2D8|nr:uncharacterized protein LOC109862600 [Pseudomyrmex gracilis]
MIAQFTGRNQRAWDKMLPELQFAVNTAHHESTGYTPAFLNYGQELRAPGSPHTGGINRPPNFSKRLEQLEAARELARINTARAFQKQASQYDLRRRAWRPKIGEKVNIKTHELSDKAQYIAAKLSPKYKGPFTVTRIVSPVIVDLRGENGKYARHIHVSQLKEFGENMQKRNLNNPTPDANRADEAE